MTNVFACHCATVSLRLHQVVLSVCPNYKIIIQTVGGKLNVTTLLPFIEDTVIQKKVHIASKPIVVLVVLY